LWKRWSRGFSRVEASAGVGVEASAGVGVEASAGVGVEASAGWSGGFSR